MDELNEQAARSIEWDLIVIGKGYAGITNCITRLHMQTLPQNVLLVGEDDPWNSYKDHRMGQYRCLLSLPGFYSGLCCCENMHEFKHSKEFATENRLHFEKLLALKTHNVHHITGLIKEKLSRTGSSWVVTLEAGTGTVSVSGRNLDICTGPGLPRSFDPSLNNPQGPWSPGINGAFDSLLLKELKDRKPSSAYIAEDFMRNSEAHENLIVVGEGALSAGVVEHALNIGCENVTWIARSTRFAEGFPPSKRYDDLLLNADELRDFSEKISSQIENRNPIAISDLISQMLDNIRLADPRLKVVLGSIASVNRTELTVVSTDKSAFAIISGNQAERLDVGSNKRLVFDGLVVSASSINGPNEILSAAWLLDALLIEPDYNGLVPLIEDDMFVGLCNPDKSLRILGATSRNGYILSKLEFSTNLAEHRFERANERYEAWHDSLCSQAQMPFRAMGITVGAASIARANRFYTAENLDEKCIQTAELANSEILARRSKAVNPFEKHEIEHDRWRVEAIKY